MRYCSSCGCPRLDTSLDPCPECGDWQFSIVPQIQHQGWLERGGKPVELVQGELFNVPTSTKTPQPSPQTGDQRTPQPDKAG